MIDTNIPKKIMNKLKNDVSDIVIISKTSNANQIKFSNNKVSITQNWINNSISLFVAKDKKVIATTLLDFKDESINKSINLIKKNLSLMQKNEDYHGIAQGPFKYNKIPDLYDKNIVDYDFSDKLEAGINKSLEIGAKRNSGLLEAGEAEYLLLTSNNIESVEKLSSIHFSVRALYDKDASGHITSSSRVLNNDFHIIKSCEEAAEIAIKAKNPVQGKKGNYDIIFSPLGFAPLLDRVGDASSYFNLYTHLSFLINKLNKKVAHENIILRDDSTIPNGIGSQHFDSEGVSTQNNKIIDKGILKTYLHNTSTAIKANTKTTANAGLITPQPWNLVLDSTNKIKKQDLFKEVKNGLYVTNIWYTRFQNQETGEFSTIPRDGIFIIKNGEIQGSIKEIRISDLMPRILENIPLVANDLKQIRSWEAEIPCLLPHILIKNVNVTTSTS